MQLADFPRWMRGLLALTLILFFFNAIYALAFLTAILTTWRIDPGVATLIGAVLGLTLVAWQARLGFKNLIQSQEHRANIESDARLEQHALDLQREQLRAAEERRILMAALRAEIEGLHHRASDTMGRARMMQRLHEAFAKGKAPTVQNSFIGPTFEAPVYQANVSKIGLLGPSLGGDVVKVMSVTSVKQVHMTFDPPMPHEMVATLYEGVADRMHEWQGELHHVAMRLAVEEGTPDPGTLTETRREREANKGTSAPAAPSQPDG